MPRKKTKSFQRNLEPDIKYGNVMVTKLINKVMKSGKKRLAESLVYGAFEIIEAKTKTPALEVFDTAMISGLVRSSDSSNLVDKYIGDLILGMDRIGRIQFLFLQHYDDFKERYGEEDMIELEDSLRNTFKSTGELILFLKQKAMDNELEDDRVGSDTLK